MYMRHYGQALVEIAIGHHSGGGQRSPIVVEMQPAGQGSARIE